MYLHLKKLFPETENLDLLKHQQVTRLDLLNALNLLVGELKTTSKEEQPKKWLKSSEVKALLRISPGTLQNLRINGTLTYTKIGGIIFYSYEEILKVMEQNKVNRNTNE
ncbi:helix-turn-helix domain-containing protein [Polaribacter sp. Asnod6-C07]|uniref:helix-turn-helix domain-containing protein n=1 Tax=Polaribacter sp. Asnod6-C07 TaxID=3160582 RepID=UPI00386B12EE